MELFEQLWVKVYSMKVAHEEGDLSALSKEERKHLTLLMRKYELEQQSVELNAEMSQTKLL